MTEEKFPDQNLPKNEQQQERPEENTFRSSYTRKHRIMAWIGVAFMVFLTLMFAYCFASGKILLY